MSLPIKIDEDETIELADDIGIDDNRIWCIFRYDPENQKKHGLKALNCSLSANDQLDNNRLVPAMPEGL